MDCWISEDPVYVLVRNETPAQYDTKGRQIEPARRHVFAKFTRGTAPRWATSIGIEAFGLRKMPERGITKEQWLAWYDVHEDRQVHGWTDEEVAEIISRLDGDAGHAAIRVELPKLKAPWPTYHKLVVQGQRTIDKVAAKIAETVDELGLNPADVIVYEEQNLNRPEVVAALEALSAEVEEDEPLVAA